MIKKTKLFALPKFGSFRDSISASLKIGEILAIRKNLAIKWASATRACNSSPIVRRTMPDLNSQQFTSISPRTELQNSWSYLQ